MGPEKGTPWTLMEVAIDSSAGIENGGGFVKGSAELYRKKEMGDNNRAETKKSRWNLS